VTMHNREHIVILRPGSKGVLLHTMFYADEIRQVEEFRTDTSQVKEKELSLAKMLIESLMAEFEPGRYSDSYRTNLQKMIQAKLEGQHVVETPTPHIAPVIDIMEALKKSLAEQKKPVRLATAAVAEAEEEAPAEPVAKKKRRSNAGR
jgi:DNA end-binding protein Ku